MHPFDLRTLTMGFYVRKGFNFGPLRVNFPSRASDCLWASKGCVLVPDRTEVMFMQAERAFTISRSFLKSAKAKYAASELAFADDFGNCDCRYLFLSASRR